MQGKRLNKSIKIWLNYLIGAAVSAVLLWSIWLQVRKQISGLEGGDWLEEGEHFFLILAIVLMPINIGIEARKWKLLASSAQPVTYLKALQSMLAGIAISLLTPNRIGEYPGRLLYLGRKSAIRLISVSILGAFAQFVTLFLYGIVGLVYYNLNFPGFWPRVVLFACIAITLIFGALFLSFEKWIVYFENSRWLRKLQIYNHLLRRFTAADVWTILGLSILRFAIYTTQYVLLLYWMKIPVSVTDGFLMACLFFWSIAVIPSVALAEMGIRGKVSLFLFGHFTTNALGVLTVTVGLWCINLVLPALIGSVLLLRLKLLR